MEWNIEKYFSMEWKIFSLEWKKFCSMEYGKIVFHSIHSMPWRRVGLRLESQLLEKVTRLWTTVPVIEVIMNSLVELIKTD